MDSDKKLCNNVYETSKPTNLESNLIKSECLKRTLDGLVSHVSDSKEERKSAQHQDEKVDVSPEISNKKSNDTSPMELDKISDNNRMNKSFSLHAFPPPTNHHHQSRSHETKNDDPSEVSKNMAFTIDFGTAKKVDEQRHKNLLERFQNRHRRGVSLSKVEDEMCESSSSSQLTAKLKSPASAKLPRKGSVTKEIDTPQKPSSANSGVRLREKSKTTQLRDASKRHSWSPRSSMVEQSAQPQRHSKPTSSKVSNPLERPLKLHALSKADMKPMPPTTLNIQCLQTPLENKQSHVNDDQVSEAGTYTLDGDNYTEEQKEKMNIDKLAMDHEAELLERKLAISESGSNIETDLEVIDLEHQHEHDVIRHAAEGSRKNILEVSFYHQEPTLSVPSNSKHKVSYLEKLKSKMKNIGDKKFKSKSPDGDAGMFTSVTTSGVLSIKPTLETNPRLKRRNSLTKSQIDSSEYVQGIQRPESKGSITDNDKAITAGYQLNMFPKQSPAKSRKESVGSSNTSISTAATKDDWIQEWARNAREFSRQKRTPIAPVMSNSYNFEGSREKSDQFGYFNDDAMTRSDCKPQYEEFGDNLDKYHQKNQYQKKPPTAENQNDDNLLHRQSNNLSNQGSVSSARGRKVLRDFDMNKEEPRMSTSFNIKPPISPSRIPSPIGSVSNRQKRFGSNAMLYGSETDLTNDTELYLQRTAAAISTLQNLQRRNSLRNSSLQNSPVSPMSPTRPPIVQSHKVLTQAPSHLRAQSVTHNSVHKRNSSLDSSRYTPAMSTSLQSNHLNHIMEGKKQLQQQHSRHNSYDGMLPPHRPSNVKYSQFDQTDDDDYESMPSRALPERQHVSIKQQHHQNALKHHAHHHQQQQQQQQSPIKRSSSFSVKPQDVPSPARASGTPKMHNKFTKTFSAPAHGSRIQKSASSTCFKQASDDDYENEFYINDDDDLHPNQLTPSEGSDEELRYSMNTANDPPITNTRFNKTFLMRCEQNKKAASGVPGGKGLGVMACPNTPELPRRNLTERSSARDRASMPRDSSLGRLQDRKSLSAGTPTTKASAPAGGKVTSKYLDISKYKTERGNNFLKRDESKNYLNREIKKSSTSACLQNFQRDFTRTSNRSSGGGSGSRPSSGNNKKKEVKNTKEVELAMWKRRASYDPLKAAAEGKKKAEEAKRLAQQQQMMMSSESNSSALRSSKSYAGTADNWIDDDDDDDSSSEFDDEN